MKKAQKIAKYSVILTVLAVIVGIGVIYHQSVVSGLEKELNGKDHEMSLAKDKVEEYRKVVFDTTPEAVLVEVNKLRAEVGVAPLGLDEKLNASAMTKARDMAKNDYFDHVNPKTGKSGYTYIFDYSGNECKYGGENIAVTPYSRADAKYLVVDIWKESRPHYEGMIDAKYSKIGFGIARSKDGSQYAVQHFCELR